MAVVNAESTTATGLPTTRSMSGRRSGIVRASEEEGVDVRIRGQHRLQVSAQRLLGLRPVEGAGLHQWDQSRAGTLRHDEPCIRLLNRIGIRPRLDRACGGNDADVPLRVAAAAATPPGRTTPTTGTAARSRTWGSAREVAVLQAMTRSLTSCPRSQETHSSVNARTSSAGRGPYGVRALSPR